jgi:type VI secretion system protein ImpH
VNQGFFVLFALADGYYRLSRQMCEAGDADILLRLFALVGLGHDAMRKNIFRTPGALLRATGLLTQFPRSAAGLRGLLADRIGAPVEVIQCVPREAGIPMDQCCRLNHAENALGEASWIGFTAPDATGKFAVIAGPLRATTYRRFLPGRPDHEELLKLIRFYVTQPLAFDVTFVLGSDEAQPGRVGEEQWSQLGYDVWLAPEPGAEARADFPERA